MDQPDKIEIFDAQEGTRQTVSRVNKTEKEWRKQLSPEQFKILRRHGTEPPFSGDLLDKKAEGVYQCAACGTDLFVSSTKFESGTGWPSFYEPVAESNIGYTDDFSLFTKRTEVHCARCGGHLGHVFDDGPKPTGKRYCINSAALDFLPSGE